MTKALVVYESMYGNTHVVADHIAAGLRTRTETTVVPVGEATPELLVDVSLLVVGGPTHVHGMTSSTSRKSAVEDGEQPDLDPDAEGPGLRDWFHGLTRPEVRRFGVAFDTRVKGPPAITGRASKGIDKRIRRHGYAQLVEPMSFLVDKDNHLIEGEADRATTWGVQLASVLDRAPATA